MSRIDDRITEKIISAAYGEADKQTREEVKKLIASDQSLRNIYLQNRENYKAARSLKMPECPDNVVSSVYEKAGINDKKKGSFLVDLYSIFAGRMFAPAAGAAIVIIIAALLFTNRQPDYGAYSKPEVELAEKQAVESLMFVSDIFARAGNTLTQDVLGEKISKPINKSVNVMNELFKNGGSK